MPALRKISPLLRGFAGAKRTWGRTWRPELGSQGKWVFVPELEKLYRSSRAFRSRGIEAVIGGGAGAGAGAVSSVGQPEVERPERILGGALAGAATALLASFVTRGEALRRVARIREAHAFRRWPKGHPLAGQHRGGVLLPIAGEMKARKFLRSATSADWTKRHMRDLRGAVGEDVLAQRMKLTVSETAKEIGKRGGQYSQAFTDGVVGKSRSQWAGRGKKYLDIYDNGLRMRAFQHGYTGQARPRGVITQPLEEAYAMGKTQRLNDLKDKGFRSAVEVESRRVLNKEILQARNTVRLGDRDTQKRIKRMLGRKPFRTDIKGLVGAP